MLQLKKFPDIPDSTREEAREFRPHPEELRFRLLARETGSFRCWPGKNSRRSCRISSGGTLHRKGERNSRVVPPFPESSRYLSPFQGKLFSLHCFDFQARVDSHHCATWDSTVGKPRGKALMESHRSLDPHEGKRGSDMTERLHFHFSLSCIGEGNGNPLQCSCLKNPVDRGAWWAAVCRVAQSRTRLKRLSMHACIGDGNGNPLQCSCLKDPRDRGAWWAAIYGVAQGLARLKQLSSSSSSISFSAYNYLGYFNHLTMFTTML